MARSIPSMLSRNHSCAWCSSSARLRSVTSTTVPTNSSSSPDAVKTGCAIAWRCFSGALRRNDPELKIDVGGFTDSSLERFGEPRTIFRMNALEKLFERWDSLFGIEAVQAGVFIGGVGQLSGGDVQGSSPGMGQPLRLGQVGFASPQFGCPLGHLHLELVSGFAKLFFGSRALVDEACALKCCRSVIRGKAKQQLVNLRGKVDAITGRSNHTALGIDTDGNDNTAARLRRRRRRRERSPYLRAGRSWRDDFPAIPGTSSMPSPA